MVSNMIIKTYHRRIYTCIYIYTRAYWSVQGLYVLFFYINIPYIYGLNMIQTSHLFHINMLNMGLICFKVVHIKHYKHLKTIMRVCVLIYDQLMHIHWLIWNIDHYNKLHFYWYIYIAHTHGFNMPTISQAKKQRPAWLMSRLWRNSLYAMLGLQCLAKISEKRRLFEAQNMACFQGTSKLDTIELD